MDLKVMALKDGDFVVSSYTAFGFPGIVKIISAERKTLKHISYKENYRGDHYKDADTIREVGVLRELSVLYSKDTTFNTSLEAFAKMLKEQPLIRKSEKENFAEFLKQKLIEEFGSPPAKPVEDTEFQLVEETDLLIIDKPKVTDGQVEGFIRINNI
jgi:hypothetical protein